MEQKFHGSESSLYGLFAPWNESAEERKGQLPLQACPTGPPVDGVKSALTPALWPCTFYSDPYWPTAPT